jgi:hypothetical protein
MPRTPSVHYVVTSGRDGRVREFDTLDEACDAIVLQFPVGVDFTIRRVIDARVQEVVLRATKSTTRQLYAS